MSMIKKSLIGLRHDPRFLKLPSYLSLLCIVVGVAWLLILPLDEYSRHTYVSENALLPGQVSTYFGGSEHNVFRAYRHEVSQLLDANADQIAKRIGEIFESQGLKTATQKYSLPGGQITSGENVYAVLQGPRADATEAIVLMAGWRNMDGAVNQSGVALVLALARYFKRWSLWSKDILFVITTDSTAGPQAWVDAYHGQHDPAYVEDLPIKGGALQGALALDYTAGTSGHRFDKIHVIYDGINGQLPNLDLFNSVVHIAKDHMGIGCTVQRMWSHADSYKNRLQTILNGMISQGLGSASGPHSSFIPYHVDAVTLQTIGDGWHDEMSLGRVVESTFRSLNNLLEHLHQSFFFYLLTEAQRFTSIGTYLPAAMLIAANFSISAITLWVHSGRRTVPDQKIIKTPDSKSQKQGMEVLEHEGATTLIPHEMAETAERNLFTPLALLFTAHALGVIPLYLFNNASSSSTTPTYLLTTLLTLTLPPALSHTLRTLTPPTLLQQTTTLLSATSLLLLGIALSTLSTLNFSLGLIIGLLASPLSFPNVFVLPSNTGKGRTVTWLGVLLIASPPSILAARAYAAQKHILPSEVAAVGLQGWARDWTQGLAYVIREASTAWHVGGTWTSVVVWLIWWPAWVVGGTVGVVGLGGFAEAVEGQAEGVLGRKGMNVTAKGAQSEMGGVVKDEQNEMAGVGGGREVQVLGEKGGGAM